MKSKQLRLMTISAFIIGFISLLNNNTYSNKHTNQIQCENIQDKNDLATLENNLIKAYNKMQEDPELSSNFASTFYQIIQSNPKSLEYPFKKLQKETGIYIATSSDKKLRIYSWDNNQGGSMRFFDQIVQFNDNEKINSTLKIAEEDSQSFVSKIFSVTTNKKETLYLTINNAIYSNKDASQSIFAYKITKNKLNLTETFKTKKQSLSSIHCEFDFFSVVDRPERPVELITLKNNVLNIPLINEKGIVTHKNLVYKWNGTNFKYDGIK